MNDTKHLLPYPFNDVRRVDDVNDIQDFFDEFETSYEKYLNKLKAGTETIPCVESMTLNKLVNEYSEHLDDGLDEAELHYLSMVLSLTTINEDLQNGIANPFCYLEANQGWDMFHVLYEARKGNIQSAQLIVQSCPSALYLPFIVKNLIFIMQDYKSSLFECARYLSEGEVPDEKEYKKKKKDDWLGFLPSKRTHEIDYNFIEALVNYRVWSTQGKVGAHAALKEISEAFPTDRSQDDYDPASPRAKSKYDNLKKHITFKGSRGRPRK